MLDRGAYDKLPSPADLATDECDGNDIGSGDQGRCEQVRPYDSCAVTAKGVAEHHADHLAGTEQSGHLVGPSEHATESAQDGTDRDNVGQTGDAYEAPGREADASSQHERF
jgi:hypothetical protein